MMAWLRSNWLALILIVVAGTALLPIAARAHRTGAGSDLIPKIVVPYGSSANLNDVDWSVRRIKPPVTEALPVGTRVEAIQFDRTARPKHQTDTTMRQCFFTFWDTRDRMWAESSFDLPTSVSTWIKQMPMANICEGAGTWVAAMVVPDNAQINAVNITFTNIEGSHTVRFMVR
ncbi:hypothetical protein ACNQQN_01490 [Mycobacteroides chelonae]|jgi:hypothetical protein|uniref:hypothetical protein n=2 Tax=Mycobacteroides chelonae TaxID=1774 RepID=UPI0009CEB363|nr:hypothetical protein [Mycobacteroides chelonae]MBF9523402.1 hypothetical protein [Mycobacteroides chelonae]SKN90991.1 Uncharacterised protein [Mycobacteroides abscessus subsp. bolletii]